MTGTQLETVAKALSQPTPSFTPVPTNLLQRKCACGGMPEPPGECAECRKKRLQRRSNGQAEPSTVPPIVHVVLCASGQPLDAETRAYMEPSLGHDFARVRRENLQFRTEVSTLRRQQAHWGVKVP